MPCSAETEWDNVRHGGTRCDGNEITTDQKVGGSNPSERAKGPGQSACFVRSRCRVQRSNPILTHTQARFDKRAYRRFRVPWASDGRCSATTNRPSGAGPYVIASRCRAGLHPARQPLRRPGRTTMRGGACRAPAPTSQPSSDTGLDHRRAQIPPAGFPVAT